MKFNHWIDIQNTLCQLPKLTIWFAKCYSCEYTNVSPLSSLSLCVRAAVKPREADICSEVQRVRSTLSLITERHLIYSYGTWLWPTVTIWNWFITVAGWQMVIQLHCLNSRKKQLWHLYSIVVFNCRVCVFMFVCICFIIFFAYSDCGDTCELQNMAFAPLVVEPTDLWCGNLLPQS